MSFNQFSSKEKVINKILFNKIHSSDLFDNTDDIEKQVLLEQKNYLNDYQQRISQDMENNFVTACFGAYNDTFFGITTMNQELSDKEINLYSGRVFQTMIRAGVVTKKSEHMIVLVCHPDNKFHISCIYRDEKSANAITYGWEILDICKEILLHHGSKNYWICCSSYDSNRKIKYFDEVESTPQNSRVEIFDSISETIEELTFGYSYTTC